MFVKDVVGNRQLADVMKQCSRAERFDIRFAKPENPAKADGIDLRAANVSDADLISCVNGGRESFDRRQMNAARLGDLTCLLSKTLEVQPVSHDRDSDYWSDNERDPRSKLMEQQP